MMNALTIVDLAISQDLDRNALATITGAGYHVHLNNSYSYGSYGSYYDGSWVGGELDERLRPAISAGSLEA